MKALETFMETTGIRDYCSNYCRGRCCCRCYGKETDCAHNEGRRIACSAFLCNSLRDILFHEDDSDWWYKRLILIDKRAKTKHGYPEHIYFEPPIDFDKFKKEFKAPDIRARLKKMHNYVSNNVYSLLSLARTERESFYDWLDEEKQLKRKNIRFFSHTGEMHMKRGRKISIFKYGKWSN